MALFQGIELRVASGDSSTAMHTVERLQSVNWNADLPRAQVKQLNRFRPDVSQQVINYTPVNLSFDYVKSNNHVEAALGLTNPTGIICGIINSKVSPASHGIRNFELFQANLESTTYIGQINISSGVLNSYSINVSPTEQVRSSFSYNALDAGFVTNTAAKTGVTTTSTAIRGQDVAITASFITSMGVTNFSPQSFSLNLNISRNEVVEIGSQFPRERPITDASVSIQMQGFFDSNNTNFTGFGSYSCGDQINGNLTVVMTPPCGAAGATTYTIVKPYVKSIGYGASVGSMTSVDLAFDVPLPINAIESGNGASNVIIS